MSLSMSNGISDDGYKPAPQVAVEPYPDDIPSQEVLWGMKRIGLPKPDNVPTRYWTARQDINERNEVVADMLLLGYTKKAIADRIGYDRATVSSLTNDPSFRAYFRERRKIQEQAITKEIIDDMFDDAVDTLREVMGNEGEKGSVRADVAKYVIDQSVGKAKQDVRIEKSILVDVINRVEELKNITGSTRTILLDKSPSSFDDALKGLNLDSKFTVGNRNEETTSEQGSISGDPEDS